MGSLESQSSADSKEKETTKPPFTTRKKINQRPQLIPVPDWKKYHQLWNPIDQKQYMVPDSNQDPDDTEDFNSSPGVGAPKAASGKGVLKYGNAGKIGHPQLIPAPDSKKYQNLQRPKEYKYTAPDSASDPDYSEGVNFTPSNLQDSGHHPHKQVSYNSEQLKKQEENRVLSLMQTTSVQKPVKKSPGRWIYGKLE